MTPAADIGTDPDRVLVGRLVEALREGSLDGAHAVVDRALAQGMPSVDVLSQLLTPAMQGIGDLWEAQALEVGDEHLATSIAERLVAYISPLLIDGATTGRGTVVLAALGEEQHVLGLRMAADVLEGAGYDVLYLGSRVPVDALVAFCARHRPELAGFTLAYPMPLRVREVVARLATLERPPGIMLGGTGSRYLVSRDPLVRIVSDVGRAVPVAEELLAERRRGRALLGARPIEWPGDAPALMTPFSRPAVVS